MKEQPPKKGAVFYWGNGLEFLKSLSSAIDNLDKTCKI
jgi:hypothetical protein